MIVLKFKLEDLLGKSVEDEADRLFEKGYRRISWSYRLVSRIDRKDWKEVLAKRLGSTLEEGLERVEKLGGRARDLYRRSESKDRLVVSEEVIKLIPSSSAY